MGTDGATLCTAGSVVAAASTGGTIRFWPAKISSGSVIWSLFACAIRPTWSTTRSGVGATPASSNASSEKPHNVSPGSTTTRIGSRDGAATISVDDAASA